MGKSKHKKHHKSEYDDDESSLDGQGEASTERSSSSLKLILKVGVPSGGLNKGYVEKHKKKKKKKEKDKKKDKEHKHKHHHKDKEPKNISDSNMFSNIGNSQDENDTLSDLAVFTNQHGSYASTPNPSLLHKDIPMEEDLANVTESLVQTTEEQIYDTLKNPESELSRKALVKLLEHFLHHLQRKDTNHFFAVPVDDQFAPGYSEIIKEPMDFSTMRSKLNCGKYLTLSSFKNDFELMCNNACVYNMPETIYYKSAKKLLHQGLKMFSWEKIHGMKCNAPYIKYLTEAELGFDPDENRDGPSSLLGHHHMLSHTPGEADDVSKVIEDLREVIRRPIGRFEAIPDDMSPQALLDSVRAAARGASNLLRIKKPKTRLGYLTQLNDGTTTMHYLPCGPGKLAVTGETANVSLEALITTIKQGAGTIQIYRENRTHELRELYSPRSGPHRPSYESVFSKLTDPELDQVKSAYGDDAGLQYAESILNYARNCDYAMCIVDNLLDILTGNEHRKTFGPIEEQKNIRLESALLDSAFQSVPTATAAVTDVDTETDVKVDFDSLRSLSQEGIDMSFLDNLLQQFKS